jgi:hypothetical protein
MAKKRAKFLETRIFGFVIAAAVIALTLLVGFGTGLLSPLELKTLDTHFMLKEDGPRGLGLLGEEPQDLRGHPDSRHRLQYSHEVRKMAFRSFQAR